MWIEFPAMASKLEIADRMAGDVLVLTLTGQMLLDDGDLAFGRRIDDFVGRGIVKFVVDLGAVTYIDSSGVGMMAAELKHVRARGGDMRLLHLNSRAQRLFGTMKLLIVFETFEDEAAAVRSFVARPTV
jgi:anti-sigma B factor antagonist